MNKYRLFYFPIYVMIYVKVLIIFCFTPKQKRQPVRLPFYKNEFVLLNNFKFPSVNYLFFLVCDIINI